MAKQYTAKENLIILNETVKVVKDDLKHVYEYINVDKPNEYNLKILSNIKPYVKNRTDKALLLQIRIVVCAIYLNQWSSHTRGLLYKEMFNGVRGSQIDYDVL